jgi:hypothetical protein
MLTLLQNITDTVLADPTMQGFIANRVYPDGVDIDPETTLFPLLTIHSISEVTLTNPKYERDCLIQISIWSRLSHLETEQIAERLLDLFNYQQFNTGYGTTIQRWQREDAGVDLYESDRRIWHKAITFRIWAKS